MMQKPKRQPKNFLRYLVDEYILFRRDFYFESHVPAGLLTSKLNDVGVKILKTEEGRDFEINLSFRRGVLIEANGKLYQNDSGLTVITGSSTTTKMLNIIALCYATLIACGASFAGSRGILLLILSSCLILILWFDIYRDRNKAIKFLQQVIDSASNDDKAKTS